MTASFPINFDKFKEPVSRVTPAIGNAWKKAMGMVQSDWKRVWDHPNLKLLRGYPVLDPFTICNGDPQGRPKVMIISWLCIRAAWLVKTTSREDSRNRIPTPNDWKDYLTIVVGSVLEIGPRFSGWNLSLIRFTAY